MSVEGFFDFMIFGYLNMKTAVFNLNGEILGIIFGTFSLMMAGIILPITIIIALLTFNKKIFSKEFILKNLGVIFEMVKTKKLSSQIYMIVFYIRRIIILAFCFFFLNKYPSLVLVLICV
jgi:hypothetical protein